MKLKQLFFLVLLTVAIPLAGQQKLPVVTAAPATNGEYAPFVVAIGEVRAEESVPLTARVQGEIIRINFTEGQKVSAGTVLFEIDPSEYKAKVQSAEADVAKAKADFEHASNEYERHMKLVDVDSDAKIQQYKNQKLQAEAAYKAALAQLELAKLNLKYTVIKAPFDGWIGFRDCSLHELVGPGTAKQQLATIEKSGGIKVDFSIAETDLITLQRNMKADGTKLADVPVELYLQDGTKVDLKGTLKAWDNRINTNTGTLKMQAVFADPDRKLIPGLYVKVQLNLGKPVRKIRIPLAAVTYDIAGAYVFVLTGINGDTATVERRYIKIDAKDITYAFLESGLQENELIIIAGIQKVRAGIRCQFQKGQIK